MPHRSADHAPPSRGGYNPHFAGGTSYPPPPPPHMMHPSEAGRMAAYQRAQAYGAHPYRMPPPMWHPADAAAHLNRTEMGYPDAVGSHAPRSTEASPMNKRVRADTMESAEETAATALLMASGFRSSPKPKESEQENSTDSITREPPKKRKKHLDVLRRNQAVDSDPPTTGSPCHVSPGSASSREGDGHTDEIITIVTQSSRLFESSSASYDTKETKKEDLPHFPSVLHKVLDMPDVNSILQWLPHGEAWKIVRWDALRREILPQYFPELCKGDDGSMDSFLGQVRAWGFEEITGGPDAGAYRHKSFVRGTPKLCKHMTYKGSTSPGSPDTAKSHGSVDSRAKGTKSPEASQSILQVPSLTSRSDGEQEPKQAIPDQQDIHLTNCAPSNVTNVHERASPVHHGWQHGGMAMSYRTPDGGYADPRLVHQTSPLRHGVTFPPPYSPRFPFRTPGGQPSPLKSGRGGSRLSRTSFPVSQRGKGSRARIVRSPITTPKNEAEETQSPGLGPHLQKESGVTDISRKMTRKLPLSRKAVADAKESSADANASEALKVNEDLE